MYHDYIEKHLIKLILDSVKYCPSAFYYYQNKARIYLDEYPKQDKIRKRFFYDYILNKLHKENYSTFAKENKIDITWEKLYETIQKLKTITKDRYFENRWLRRQ